MIPLGNRIEDYQVQNLLGKGGFASVHRARCLKTGIEVAIKMIDKQHMKAKNMINRVIQEVEIHLRLKHSSILELYKWFDDNDYVYLVLELCPNGDLQNYLREKKTLSDSEVSNIMTQVVEGIKYLHSYNILHRDLSLSNLLLSSNMKVKIADFGLATQLATPDEKHMTLCGTPNFISPEVATRGSHGREADVWGLGCLLYTLLVGEPPFESPGVKSTLTKIAMESYNLPSYLTSDAKDLINCLLQKNPNDRMKLDQILEHPFIKKGRHMVYQVSHDSGNYTMSSKRDSTFDNISLPHSQNAYATNGHIRKANSNCLPLQNNYADNQLPSDMERLRVRSYEGLPTYRDSRPTEQISRCSQHSHCCCNRPATSLRSCSQERAIPVDPGGYQYQPKYNNGSLHSHHSDPPLSSNAGSHINHQVSGGYIHSPHLQTEKHIAQRDHSSRKIERKSTLTPLCSERLLPTRHQTGNAVLSILKNGEVCIEFLKNRKTSNNDFVRKVMRISPDGMRIVVYELKGGRGVPLSEEPAPVPSQGADQIYGLENLPEKLWSKYAYAVTFVDLVKAKTPKVTYYTDKAKCFLMENLYDFEACFYDGGKVTKAITGGITIIDASGNKFHDKTEPSLKSSLLNGTLEFLWSHSQQSFDYCVLLEKTLSTLPRPSFPIIVGRKPNSTGSVGKENHHNHQQTMPSFTVSYTGTNIGSTFANSSNAREKKIVVPGVGTASRLANGVVQVCFNDGSQMEVDGKTVNYRYPNGHISYYTEHEDMPPAITEKVQHVPKVLKFLNSPSVTQKIVNLR
ncbi:serine/threonine-protein kinase PLK4 [Diabrotica virgifera virgifera]|uniref:Serine/threonine-protein kinase PLK4 n=1 Tax=Diabrotica virgifera virgifera TaxID=50390 RepID=A0ABM5IQS8_DIAVI|nr:serine/threonine-protein kinase PLK4 [Diabrotica virgifera virgifera]